MSVCFGKVREMDTNQFFKLFFHHASFLAEHRKKRWTSYFHAQWLQLYCMCLDIHEAKQLSISMRLRISNFVLHIDNFSALDYESCLNQFFKAFMCVTFVSAANSFYILHFTFLALLAFQDSVKEPHFPTKYWKIS